MIPIFMFHSYSSPWSLLSLGYNFSNVIFTYPNLNCICIMNSYGAPTVLLRTMFSPKHTMVLKSIHRPIPHGAWGLDLPWLFQMSPLPGGLIWFLSSFYMPTSVAFSTLFGNCIYITYPLSSRSLGLHSFLNPNSTSPDTLLPNYKLNKKHKGKKTWQASKSGLTTFPESRKKLHV